MLQGGQRQEGNAGTIRFGVTPTLGPYLMSNVILALHRQQPGLRLYIREGIPDEQALELARGQLDMLLGPLPIAGEGAIVEPLFANGSGLWPRRTTPLRSGRSFAKATSRARRC